MKKEVTFSELWDNDIDPDDMPDDTIFVWKEREHKYILDPFRVVFEGDPDYEKGITVAEAMEMLNNQAP